MTCASYLKAPSVVRCRAIFTSHTSCHRNLSVLRRAEVTAGSTRDSAPHEAVSPQVSMPLTVRCKAPLPSLPEKRVLP